MRSERRAAALVALALACREPPPPEGAAAPERFAGVRRQDAEPAAAASAFCERTWPAGGDGARRWSAPPLRPLGPAAGGAAPARGGWTWVNLWATWCTPCVEEMGLLGRWREALAREGVPVGFELLSIDEPEQEAALAAWGTRGLPGPIRWLRSPQDLPALLDALGVERDAMIPIHALVDAAGFVRCVRVGAIHEQDYAAVKRLLGR